AAAASTRRATSWASPSIAGRTATPTSTTRSGTPSGLRISSRACSAGSGSAGSASPMPTPAPTPTPTAPSTRRTAPCPRSCTRRRRPERRRRPLRSWIVPVLGGAGTRDVRVRVPLAQRIGQTPRYHPAGGRLQVGNAGALPVLPGIDVLEVPDVLL